MVCVSSLIIFSCLLNSHYKTVFADRIQIDYVRIQKIGSSRFSTFWEKKVETPDLVTALCWDFKFNKIILSVNLFVDLILLDQSGLLWSIYILQWCKCCIVCCRFHPFFNNNWLDNWTFSYITTWLLSAIYWFCIVVCHTWIEA